MGVINTETGAIEEFLWIKAQDGIKIILESVSGSQSAINSDYAFQVHSNLYRPSIESIENVAMVNIRIGKVDNIDETYASMTQQVTYYIDCYVRGQNEGDPDNPVSLVPADEAAVQRLHYLVAMVYSGITNLANYYFGLNSGEIVPGKIGIVFNPVEDVEDSATPYAPAQITFTCDFPYDVQDLTGLPEWESTYVKLSSWAAQIFKE
jgi:hypothetical protein